MDSRCESVSCTNRLDHIVTSVPFRMSKEIIPSFFFPGKRASTFGRSNTRADAGVNGSQRSREPCNRSRIKKIWKRPHKSGSHAEKQALEGNIAAKEVTSKKRKRRSRSDSIHPKERLANLNLLRFRQIPIVVPVPQPN